MSFSNTGVPRGEVTGADEDDAMRLGLGWDVVVEEGSNYHIKV